MAASTDPRSRLFPPAVPVVATGLGIALQRFERLALVARPASWWIGGALIAAWLVLAALANYQFRRAGTTPNPFGDVTAFVTGGVFGFTRNPMYLGLVLLQAGVAFILSNGWVLLLVVPTIIVLDRLVIAGEERYLDAKYGATYAAYRNRVRRWL